MGRESVLSLDSEVSCISIRRASKLDLDAIVDVVLAAMPMDPQWDWRFPKRKQFPEDTKYFTKLKYAEFLHNIEKWHVMVAEYSSEVQLSTSTIIAVAVWEVANLHLHRSRPKLQRIHRSYLPVRWREVQTLMFSATRNVDQSNMFGRRDGDKKRMRLWTHMTTTARQRLFDDCYGSRHIQLQILATHPTYQRKGAGKALCNWGIEMARRRGMVICVFASPMGRYLYGCLGFRNKAHVRIWVDGESESILLAAMIYEPVTLMVSGKR